MIKKNIKNIGVIAKKKAGDIGDAAAAGVKKGFEKAVDKIDKVKYERDMKKYNPLFMNKYTSQDFDKPNIIMIVDDAKRRDIEVAEGAIGWCEDNGVMEVLCLYDTYIDKSEIQFVPAAICGNVYYKDTFVKNRYVQIENIFEIALKEKIAELKYIANCLGAKRCAIEIVEEIKSREKKSANYEEGANANIKKINVKENAKMSSETSRKSFDKRSGKTVSEFSGNNNPIVPELKWFEHDDNIKRLIEMRVGCLNPVKTDSLELIGSSSATMTQAVARAIDTSISKMGVKANISMQDQVEKEMYTKLKFDIEF